MKKAKTKKFKAIEENKGDAPTTDKLIEWEGEELSVQSDTKLESDLGTGQPIVLRFFDFGVNYETFKQHKPTAQELFNCHWKGIETMLWADGLKPFDGVAPRLLFAKDKKFYRFIIAAIPSLGNVLVDIPKTLTQLIRK